MRTVEDIKNEINIQAKCRDTWRTAINGADIKLTELAEELKETEWAASDAALVVKQLEDLAANLRAKNAYITGTQMDSDGRRGLRTTYDVQSEFVDVKLTLKASIL